MDKLVDFSQPIEAYHTDGSVVAAVVRDERPHPANGCYWVSSSVFSNWVMPGCDLIGNGWRVRNVVHAKPSTPSNEELTQRMEAYIRRVAADGYTPGDIAEARAIVSDLPKPVDPIDPDLLIAREIANQIELMRAAGDEACAPDYTGGFYDDHKIIHAVRKGLEAGRTLAAGGTA